MGFPEIVRTPHIEDIGYPRGPRFSKFGYPMMRISDIGYPRDPQKIVGGYPRGQQD